MNTLPIIDTSARHLATLFVSYDFTCTWEGFATWEPEGGYVDSHYNAEIVLRPMEKIATDDTELSKNIVLRNT